MEQEQRARRNQRSREGKRAQFLFLLQSPQLNPGGRFMGSEVADLSSLQPLWMETLWWLWGQEGSSYGVPEHHEG